MPEILEKTRQRIIATRWQDWLPLALVLLGVFISFWYGWYFDHSKPQSGIGWSDQTLYTKYAEQLFSFKLPNAWHMHYQYGYPLAGAIGKIFNYRDPFMPVALLLLLSSTFFLFQIGKKIGGTFFAIAFVVLLFYWDGAARSLNFASEIFAIPWNQQIFFAAVAFYGWLIIVKGTTETTTPRLTALTIVSGWCIAARTESALFVMPMVLLYLWITKPSRFAMAAVFLGVCAFYLPELYFKFSIEMRSNSGGRTYGDVASQYLRFDLLYRNFVSTIIRSSLYNERNPDRLSLFSAAPWVVFSVPGIYLLIKKGTREIRIFTVLGLAIIAFYLSGGNMSANKLKFGCLRYISPGFIVLNLAVVYFLYEVVKKVEARVRPQPHLVHHDLPTPAGNQ